MVPYERNPALKLWRGDDEGAAQFGMLSLFVCRWRVDGALKVAGTESASGWNALMVFSSAGVELEPIGSKTLDVGSDCMDALPGMRGRAGSPIGVVVCREGAMDWSEAAQRR